MTNLSFESGWWKAARLLMVETIPAGPLLPLEFKKSGALWRWPKTMMFKKPVEASQEVGSQAVGKIECRDHGSQKTGKSPGKQQSLLSVGQGPLPHLLLDDAFRLTKFAERLAELISNNTTFRMRTCWKRPARLRPRRGSAISNQGGCVRLLSHQFFSTLIFLE
jgi:hypothetical protein